MKILKLFKNKISNNSSFEDSGYLQNMKWSRYLIISIISSLGFGLFYLFIAKIDEVVVAFGDLQSPGSERIIKSPFSSKIKIINVKEGQKVKVGEILLELDDNKLITKISEITNNLNSLEESFSIKKDIVARFKKLNKEGAVSYIDYLNQKDELQKIEAMILQKKDNYNELLIIKKEHNITSPIDGSVFELIPSSPRYFATEGETLLKIIPSRKLEAKLFIRNQDIGFVKENMNVELKVDAFPFSNFGFIKGRIRLIGKEVLRQNQTNPEQKFPVYVTLDKQYLEKNNERFYVKPGQTVSANLIVRDKPLINIITNVFSKSFDSLKSLKDRS